VSADFTATPQYQTCQAIFDRWYPDFRNAGEQYRDLIAALTLPHTTLLDLGCGRSSLAEEPVRRAGLSLGVDLSLDDLAQNRVVSHAILATGEALPFPAAAFDLVSSQWVVEHIERPEAVFVELERVLRPGGRAVLFTTNVNNYVPLLSRALHGQLQHALIQRLLRRPIHESFPTFYRANTQRRIRQLAQATGLTLEEVRFVGNPFYLAFSPPLFRIALLFEKLTDAATLRHLKLYMIAVLRKPAE